MKVLITAICLLICTTANAQKLRYFMFGYAYQTPNTYTKAVSADNGKTYRKVTDTAGNTLASKGQYFGYICYSGHELPSPDLIIKELAKVCKPKPKTDEIIILAITEFKNEKEFNKYIHQSPNLINK